jgi:hypothetical protein
MLEKAGALCWYEPETLSAEELKKLGNASFVQQNYEGTFFLKVNIEQFPVFCV